MSDESITSRNVYFHLEGDGTYKLRLNRKVTPIKGGRKMWQQGVDNDIAVEGLSLQDLHALAAGILSGLYYGYNEDEDKAALAAWKAQQVAEGEE